MAAGILTSFIRFLAISSPFLGPYVDRIGKRRLLIIITCIIFSITHFLLGFMKAGHEGEPNYFSLIPLVMLGSCYSMYCCILIPSI
jgi:MFS family permease